MAGPVTPAPLQKRPWRLGPHEDLSELAAPTTDLGVLASSLKAVLSFCGRLLCRLHSCLRLALTWCSQLGGHQLLGAPDPGVLHPEDGRTWVPPPLSQ